MQAKPSDPPLQQSDWSDEDWRGTYRYKKANGGTNLLADWNLPEPQSNPNSKLEVDTINMDTLCLEHDNPQEEHIQVTDSLIPPPATDREEKATAKEKTTV